MNPPAMDEARTSHGKPSHKPRVDKKDVFALCLCLACFCGLILIIDPHTTLPWRLGVKNQIVIFGALLSIQQFCLQRVIQTSFVVLEAQLGHSVLQNYDAILRKDFLTDHAHPAWRTALLGFTFLPIGLGIAYKQFLDGTSTMPLSDDIFNDAKYGIAYPDLGPYASLGNSIYLSMNANSGFLNASRNDQRFPNDTAFPLAFGYNTLVLSDDSAALLDLPLPSTITAVQEKLKLNETWQISASVDGIVAMRNMSFNDLRQNENFRKQTIESAYNKFTSEYLYSDKLPGLGFGWLSVNNPELGDAYCIMGGYGNGSVPAPVLIDSSDDATSDTYLSFMESAQMFSMQRRSCHAAWSITKTTIQLLNGYCSDQPIHNSSVLHDWQVNPYAADVLPVLVNTLGPFSTTHPSSPWKSVSFVVAAANSWWARSAFLNYGTPELGFVSTKYPETQYYPQNQHIISRRPTLDAKWSLYLVSAIVPFIASTLFLALPLSYHLPIGTGFGLISILAGIDRDTLVMVRGAGLSGKVDRKIILEVSSQDLRDKPDVEHAYGVKYALSQDSRQAITGTIEKGQDYE